VKLLKSLFNELKALKRLTFYGEPSLLSQIVCAATRKQWRETMATIIDNGGGGSSAGGIIAGVLLVVVVIIGLLVFANNHGGSGTVDIDVPKVNVDVVPDGQ
jgi:hypothetical protein